jgi:NADH-quinone oxidoreductase subunit L
MNELVLMSIIVLAPFCGFLINGIGYKKLSANVAGVIATIAAVTSFVVACMLVSMVASLPEESRFLAVKFFDWINVNELKIPMAFYLDPINSIMILVITGVGSLIHLFSIGYMHHDAGAAKYFAYLNLFLLNMLILVLGDNLLVMFVGWEGVGLCSYLLIGFWFKDKDKAAAGMKAFITNRIGDAAFILGLFILFWTFGTINFQDLNQLAGSVVSNDWLAPVTLATLFLFIGATGKSAQIPLYVWLPDAMAGPTPVSALIHAATMVTAGVYMIVRLNPVFLAAPNTMLVIAVIGAATAVMAASIGMTQFDIKKVLAYSTVSQLGYMFLACGVGAFGAAMFHLMTHAFFKALMFLGSGSVIHAMHEEQDIRKMGGLKKYLPITHLTFFIGWIAIIGLPPFSGFFSKDEILWFAFNSPRGHWGLWLAGAVGASMTAFYMTRLMALTFWGKSRVPKGTHPHESPLTMTIPLIALAVLSAVGGWIGVPHVLSDMIGYIPNFLEHWFHHSIKTVPGWTAGEHSVELGLMGGSVLLAIIFAGLAYYLYVNVPEKPKAIAASLGKFYELVFNKYLIDELYFKTIINPLVNGSRNLWFYVDVNVIDKTTYAVADLSKGLGQFVRGLQNGNVQQYAMYLAIGLVVTISFIFVR